MVALTWRKTVKSSMSSLIFSHFLHCYQTSYQLCSASVWQCARRSRFIFSSSPSSWTRRTEQKNNKEKKQKHFVSVSGGDIKNSTSAKKTPNVNKTDRMALNTQRRNLSGGTIDSFHYSITVFFFCLQCLTKKKIIKKNKSSLCLFRGAPGCKIEIWSQNKQAGVSGAE